MNMVKSYNTTDVVEFGKYCVNRMPLRIDKREVERWELSNTPNFFVLLTNQLEGISIKIEGDEACHACVTWKECAETGIVFEWAGLQIHTKDNDWEFFESKTKNEFVSISIPKEVDLLDMLKKLTLEVSKLYNEIGCCSTYGGKIETKVNECLYVLGRIEKSLTSFANSRMEECKNAIKEAFKHSLNCHTTETALSSIEVANWWIEEKLSKF